MEDMFTLEQHEALAAGLSHASAYPHAADGVRRIDTHISTVLLAGDFAYKIKKPVNLGFLDFSSLERRRQSCEDEVRLNRRTAPDLYLDVVPIVGTPGDPRIPGLPEEPVLEYAVRMRRFDPDDTLDRLASGGRLAPDVIDRLAATVARLHGRADVAPAGFGAAATVRRVVESNLHALRDHAHSAVDRGRLDALAAWSQSEWKARSEQMEARASAGFVRECHGDLHLANVVLLGNDPVPFDGIEFNDALRFIDVISDVAFAFMDLADHGLGPLAWRFVSRYLEETGDYSGLSLLRYYAVHRALVRAEVALIRLRQPEVRRQVRLREHTSFEHYLALAERLCRPGSRAMVVMTGLSGSGKSTVALELAQRLGGIRVRSDVERKRLFGLPPLAGTERRIYSAEATAATYARMAGAARAALTADVPVVIDAAFPKRAERDVFRSLAAERAARFLVVACRASPSVLRRRVTERRAAGTDPSEADIEVLEQQLAGHEPLHDDEGVDSVTVDTEAPGTAVTEACAAIVHRLSGASAGSARTSPGPDEGKTG